MSKEDEIKRLWGEDDASMREHQARLEAEQKQGAEERREADIEALAREIYVRRVSNMDRPGSHGLRQTLEE